MVAAVAFHWSSFSLFRMLNQFPSWSSSTCWSLLVQSLPCEYFHSSPKSHFHVRSRYPSYSLLNGAHLSPVSCLSWSIQTFVWHESCCEPLLSYLSFSATIHHLNSYYACLLTLKWSLLMSKDRQKDFFGRYAQQLHLFGSSKLVADCF